MTPHVSPSVLITLFKPALQLLVSRAGAWPEFGRQATRIEQSYGLLLRVPVTIRRGWISANPNIEDARAYLIRGDDFGPPGAPEGIWLRWIENGRLLPTLKAALTIGAHYEVTVVARSEVEGTAYVANEKFIDSKGAERKWALEAKRPPPINENGGR